MEPMPIHSNKYKPVAIIFIVLSILLAVASGFFVWKYFDQQTQINNLNTELDQVKTQLSNSNSADPENGGTKVDPNTVTVDQLVTAYKAEGNDASNKEIEIGDAVIKNSSISPWQTITVTIGSASSMGQADGNFYREGSDGVWKYAFAAQGAPACNDILFGEHPNIARAFADMNCQVDDQSTTIFKTYYSL